MFSANQVFCQVTAYWPSRDRKAVFNMLRSYLCLLQVTRLIFLICLRMVLLEADFSMICCLQVIQNGCTLNGILSLAAFERLHRLELECIPLQYVYGLATLRGNLQNITCTGCFEKLEVNCFIVLCWVVVSLDSRIFYMNMKRHYLFHVHVSNILAILYKFT